MRQGGRRCKRHLVVSVLEFLAMVRIMGVIGLGMTVVRMVVMAVIGGMVVVSVRVMPVIVMGMSVMVTMVVMSRHGRRSGHWRHMSDVFGRRMRIGVSPGVRVSRMAVIIMSVIVMAMVVVRMSVVAMVVVMTVILMRRHRRSGGHVGDMRGRSVGVVGMGVMGMSVMSVMSMGVMAMISGMVVVPVSIVPVPVIIMAMAMVVVTMAVMTMSIMSMVIMAVAHGRGGRSAGGGDHRIDIGDVRGGRRAVGLNLVTTIVGKRAELPATLGLAAASHGVARNDRQDQDGQQHQSAAQNRLHRGLAQARQHDVAVEARQVQL